MPATIESLQKIVNNAARRISEETVRRAPANFLRGVEKYTLEEEGHFEDEI